MAKNLKIIRQAIEEILMSPSVQNYADKVGRDMASAAGTGYEYKPPTRNQRRSRGIVVPVTREAMKDNIKNMRLSKVLVSFKA